MDPTKNFAYGTVLTPPSPATTGTSVVLNSGQGARFPNPTTYGAYNVVVKPTGTVPTSSNAEIWRVTAISTDTLTITRAQEGSSARTVIAGDEVYLSVTKKTIDDIKTYTDSVLKTATDGTTVTFDLGSGAYTKHIVTLGGNRTLALSNELVGMAFIVSLKQDATGSRTVTWWSGISWVDGSAPTLTTTANKTDTFGFIITASGAYQGYIVGQNI